MPPAILIVDDDLADLLAVILAEEGYRVRAVRRGEAALAAVEHARPALVLTDVAHPGPDGIALARRLRERGIPVVLMSAGHPDPRLPGVPFLAKPFALDALLCLVAHTLGEGGNDLRTVQWGR